MVWLNGYELHYAFRVVMAWLNGYVLHDVMALLKIYLYIDICKLEEHEHYT